MKLEPRAWEYVALSGESGLKFNSECKQLLPGKYELHTLPDLLAALREPSEEMLDAPLFKVIPNDPMNDKLALHMQRVAVFAMWNSMLDAFEKGQKKLGERNEPPHHR